MRIRPPHCVAPSHLGKFVYGSYLWAMFIKAVQKPKAGTKDNPLYFRLCESFRDSTGKPRQRMIMALGYMEDLPRWADKQELLRCLNDMVLRGQHAMCDNPYIVELANYYYQKQIDSNKIASIRATEAENKAETERRKREEIVIKLSSLTNINPREIGAEHVAVSCLERLKIDRFLSGKGWSFQDIHLAKSQIAARCIYPFSEYKTVRILRDNSALCELLGIAPSLITKDKLYKSANRLYALHHDLENWLSDRVRTLFGVEDKVLLFDLTNTFFEGSMRDSSLARYGRSKERRSDCKQVVLAAVVNQDGLLVRTRIYEGNRADCSTMQEVIGSLAIGGLPSSEKKVIVMDAGISTKENLAYLQEKGYHYITVSRSNQTPYEDTDHPTKELKDNRGQIIRIKRVKSRKGKDTLLLVESKAKALKEESMYEWSLYDITLSYDKSETVTSLAWKKKADKQQITESSHGKYLLQTNLDDTSEENIWEFYNVIRTVEETFRILKSDLDIRPIYHKSGDGTKAHLHLAILGYWVVSTSRYQLKKAGINHEWGEIIRILSTHKVVSTRMQKDDEDWIEIRQASIPNEEVKQIYAALKLSEEPVKRRKFVWHPVENQKNGTTEKQCLDSG